MSDPYRDDDIEEAPPHPADPPQALSDFVGAFTDPQAGEVFRDAAVRVQDYVVQRNLAADNEAAANRLVSNLGTFKDGLASMAASDPAATFLGLDLVPDIVSGIVATHPFLPDDARADTYTQLATDMQRDIARAGVMSLADKQEDAARRLLQHPRVSELFDDADHRALNGYIGAMETARGVDAAALSQQRAKDEIRTWDHAAVQYFGALLDPQTQAMQFPNGWAQKVTSDPSLPPSYTASMLGVYAQLQTTGDANASDPFIAADLIGAVAGGEATVPSVLRYAGNDLRMADALTIAGMAQPQSDAGKSNIGALNEVVQQGRALLADPLNGPGGHDAFGRFVNWLLPAVRTGAVSLNPDEPNYAGLRLPQFAPTATDIADRTPIEGRKSLDDIFGGRRGRTT